ncbi:MAG: hypothetical protein II616_00260, partial [Bacteroidales bacterium]|nr:hypothetical protein [Bacteroidales bacterium]
ELNRVMSPYKHSRKASKDITYHMFVAKTSSPKTDITVRIYGSGGKLKYDAVYSRPSKFDPSKPE